MNNFGTIFQYECKKIFTKKIFIISLLLCVAAIIFFLTVPLLGDYYADGVRVDSNINMYLKDKEYAEALDGRIINQELIEQTVEAYHKVRGIESRSRSMRLTPDPTAIFLILSEAIPVSRSRN